MRYRRRSHPSEPAKTPATPVQLAQAKLRAITAIAPRDSDGVQVAVAEALQVGLSPDEVAAATGYNVDQVRQLSPGT